MCPTAKRPWKAASPVLYTSGTMWLTGQTSEGHPAFKDRAPAVQEFLPKVKMLHSLVGKEQCPGYFSFFPRLWILHSQHILRLFFRTTHKNWVNPRLPRELSCICSKEKILLIILIIQDRCFPDLFLGLFLPMWVDLLHIWEHTKILFSVICSIKGQKTHFVIY